MNRDYNKSKVVHNLRLGAFESIGIINDKSYQCSTHKFLIGGQT